MADPIDRQAAIKAIHDEFDECLVWDESGQHTADEVESILTSLPSADVQSVQHGHWETYIISMLDGEGCRCSECRFEGVPYWDYCPNCGARMDGEQNDGFNQ